MSHRKEQTPLTGSADSSMHVTLTSPSPSPTSSSCSSAAHLFVRSNIHMTNLDMALKKNLHQRKFVDVTLTCEGRKFQCHRLILAAASPLFERLFLEHPAEHPVVIIPYGIRARTLQALIDFMYQGQVNVSQWGLRDLVRSAELLQITGLENARQNYEQYCSNISAAAAADANNVDDSTCGSCADVPAKQRHRKSSASSSSNCGDDISIDAGSGRAVSFALMEKDLKLDVDMTASTAAASEASAYDVSAALQAYLSVDAAACAERAECRGQIRVKSQEMLLKDTRSGGNSDSSITRTNRCDRNSLRRNVSQQKRTKAAQLEQASPDGHAATQTLPQQQLQLVVKKERLDTEEGGELLDKTLQGCLATAVQNDGTSLQMLLLEASPSQATAEPLLSDTEAYDAHNTAMLSGTFVENIICQPNVGFICRSNKHSSNKCHTSAFYAEKQRTEEEQQLKHSSMLPATTSSTEPPTMETVVLRSPRNNQPRSYSTQALYNALMAVKNGESIYRASREYLVPRKTLRNWMKRWNIKSQYPMPKQLKDAALRRKLVNKNYK